MKKDCEIVGTARVDCWSTTPKLSYASTTCLGKVLKALYNAANNTTKLDRGFYLCKK
jgi:hypothetical protein